MGTEVRFVSHLRSLCQITKLGLYFRRGKLEALLDGDISNTVVNRNFVYAFQAIGMNLYGALEETPAMVQLQARYIQMCWESLVEIHRTNNHMLEAQGLVLLVHGAIIVGLTATAQQYHFKLCQTINKAELQFLPAYKRPFGLSEQVREDVTVLSQAIYLDNYFYLTRSGSRLMTERLEKEFLLDLEVIIQQFFVAGFEVDSVIWPSECTHTCSTYAH